MRRVCEEAVKAGIKKVVSDENEAKAAAYLKMHIGCEREIDINAYFLV